MSGNFLNGFIAFLSLIPATILALSGKNGRTALFWTTLVVAVVGPVIWVIMHSHGVWRSDFSNALWITISFTLICYGAVAVLTSQGWKLAPIIMPYMALLALIAAVWENAGAGGGVSITSPWVIFHVLVSVITYGVVTTGACAALAGLLRERALKNKTSTAFTGRLPSMADCDALQIRLLSIGGIVLGLGLITGMAASFANDGWLLHFDHKTILALLAFAIIGVLLVMHRKSGVRGRQAARLILAAYLLLSLAYPGVKFVTDVLMTSP